MLSDTYENQVSKPKMALPLNHFKYSIVDFAPNFGATVDDSFH